MILSANVRFTPNRGHVRRTSGCPLCAKSGHRQGQSLGRAGRALWPLGLLCGAPAVRYLLLLVIAHFCTQLLIHALTVPIPC